LGHLVNGPTPAGVLAVVRTQPLPGNSAPSGVKPTAAENRGLDEFPKGGKWYYDYRFSLEKKNPKESKETPAQ